MSLSYPLSLPTTPSSRSIRLIGMTTSAISRSIFTGSQQIFEHQGAWWEAEIELPPMRREDAEQWISFLLLCRGRAERFFLGDPGGRTPRGTAEASPGPTVNGSGQTGKVLTLAGTGTILAGDYLQVGSGTSQRLYKNLTDIALGATAYIFPPLRESPSDDAPVTMTDAKGVFRLADPQVAWDFDAAKLYGISFRAVEAI